MPQRYFMRNQPLIWAAGRGVVNILLKQQDFSPSRTLLWRATSNEKKRVVKTRVRREDVNPEEPNDWNETPL